MAEVRSLRAAGADNMEAGYVGKAATAATPGGVKERRPALGVLAAANSATFRSPAVKPHGASDKLAVLAAAATAAVPLPVRRGREAPIQPNTLIHEQTQHPHHSSHPSRR